MKLKSYLSTKTAAIPANGGIVKHDCTGNVFQIMVSDGVFSLQMDEGEPFAITGLLGFKLKGEEKFKQLTFSNATGSTVNVTYLVGVVDALYWVGK